MKGIEMTENQLAEILKDMYEKAPKGEQVVHIHLFGIKYADIIRENKYKVSDIIKMSGLHESYATELSKGIKLSAYVFVGDLIRD
ncbi:MAG: hypothetical protein PHG99_07790 [Erysipelotrichaceae bacterium]|nr:hypothetical protein [Erysipelotrichaceae bacterium]